MSTFALVSKQSSAAGTPVRRARRSLRRRGGVADGMEGQARETAPSSGSSVSAQAPAVAPAGLSSDFPSCTTAPPVPDANPPALTDWFENPTLKAIRREAPGENRTLLSEARGSRGKPVKLVQQALLHWGCDEHDRNLLPRFGADADFGAETERAVREFQKERGTKVDGIVGPVTLSELDDVVTPKETERGPPTPLVPEKKAPPAEPISSDSDMKALVKSTDLKVPRPKVVRTPLTAGDDEVSVTLDKPVSFKATAKLNPSPQLDGVRFGFFQLGRPFELWRCTYRDVNASAGDNTQNFNRDETNELRLGLPARDHSTVFYSDIFKTATATSTKVEVDYFDRPANIFETPITPPGRALSLNGVAAQSFFFTAFGMVPKNGRPLLLKTFYWSMKYCEEITPKTLGRLQTGRSIEVEGPFDCLHNDCKAGEPGAKDLFGGTGGLVFSELVKATLPKFGGGEKDAFPVGPGTFRVPCAK